MSGLKICLKLEGAETKLIKLANDARLKSLKGKTTEARPETNVDGEDDFAADSGSAAARWVSPKDRPTHRLKPLIGKKVDTINWCREEIARLNPLIDVDQTNYRAGEATPRNAVFVEFWNQTQAQAAFQMVAHHQPLHMAPRVVGLSPEEVVWSNMGITWRTRTIRNILSIAFVVVLIIFWSIPVAFVGSISQITYLTQVLPWLSFINNCPKVILGLITNLLPVIMLSILMSLVPPIMRLMGKVAGKPTLSLVELRCHESYFWFQLIQVFLVTTMSSAASAAVPEIIDNPAIRNNTACSESSKGLQLLHILLHPPGSSVLVWSTPAYCRIDHFQRSFQITGQDTSEDVQSMVQLVIRWVGKCVSLD